MGPDLLMERLQEAVAPDYRVVRRLGGGGMGHVYVAHEVSLNRDVAIKVLRPELDTEEGGEAFLREAQVLASIRHSNVVVIFRPDHGQGLKFYYMELINGPTLEDRLASGPLPARDVVQIGLDLLAGLIVVHRLGLVHRDIKPGNIFLLPDRTVLSDFGIAALASPDASESRGQGTPDYMAPEQYEGKPITPLADIYSLGVVLYEAVTGRRFHEQGQHQDWSGVDHALAQVLRRAVEPLPENRLADARAFRDALERTQRPSFAVPTAALIKGGGLLLGAIAAVVIIRWVWPHPPPPPPAPPNPNRPSVSFASIDYVGPSERGRLADSLLHLVQSDLSSHIAFGSATPPSLSIQARMTITGDDVGVHLTGGIPASEFHVPFERWSELSDSISYQIVLGVWRDRSPLASLPVRALPRRFEGLVRFLDAEELVAAAKWQEARDAMVRAEASDPTCWICAWRVTEIQRWLSVAPDPDRMRRYRLHADSLPPPYRTIILASQFPLKERLDSLQAAAEGSRDVFLAWFQLGDELFHRGPLAGHRRAEAMAPLERAARLRPDFRPAWEHLAWVATAEGDSALAAAAKDSLHPTTDAFAVKLDALLDVGFAWRFLPESAATTITAQAIGAPGVRDDPDLAAGPRYLPTFDVPRGAIALGRMLEADSMDQSSGLTAQTLGALARGRLADMRESAQKLTAVAPQADLDLFAAELPATLALLDPGSVPVRDAVAGLRPWATTGDSVFRNRAAWMSALLDHQTPLGAGTPGDLELLVAADSLAIAGHASAALLLLEPVDVDRAARRFDPFFRTIVHLRRAEWRARIGDVEGTRAELRWHEHSDVVGLPTGLPQAAEVDWAFGTLARWRLARLLDNPRRAARGEACGAYAGVIRHWLGAPAPYGARAEFARTRARVLRCPPTPAR